jgi:hypothetical protein
MEKKLAKKEPKVRALEALVAEMITAEEAGASEGKVRALEALVAQMVDEEELVVGLYKSYSVAP